MGITFYPGKSKDHLDYYTFFLDTNDIEYEISHCYFGYKLFIYSNDYSLETVSTGICSFIFEFYLKEAVISKIYDEYPLFNTDDACRILSEVSEKFAKTPVKDDIARTLRINSALNIESYFLFNMKSIMICVYALTDESGSELSLIRERERLVSMIKTFSGLSFETCHMADVEFSSDDKCIVEFDKQPFGEVSSGELLGILAQKAPENVKIKNACYFPELADIIERIFNLKEL